MIDFLKQLYSEGITFSWLEIIGVLTALIYVALAAKKSRWCFVFGFISSAIYIYLATVLKFYFDSFINIYYVGMSFYGWFVWSKNVRSKVESSGLKKTEENQLEVQVLNQKELVLWFTVGAAITIVAAFSVERFSDAQLPYIDAFTTVFAIIATWWTVKKYLQNWLVWIFVDACAAGMYFYKELYLTSMLFILYTIIAFFGYRKWKSELV